MLGGQNKAKEKWYREISKRNKFKYQTGIEKEH